MDFGPESRCLAYFLDGESVGDDGLYVMMFTVYDAANGGAALWTETALTPDIRAVLEIVHMGGGQVVVRDGAILEQLPLPIAGLVTEKPLAFVRKKVDALIEAARSCGCTLPDPFMTLSFLALSPIPALKITDQGLVDAERFERTELFVR